MTTTISLLLSLFSGSCPNPVIQRSPNSYKCHVEDDITVYYERSITGCEISIYDDSMEKYVSIAPCDELQKLYESSANKIIEQIRQKIKVY